MRTLVLLLLSACASPQTGHEGMDMPAGDHAAHDAAGAAERLGVRTVPARAGDAFVARRAPASARFDPSRTARATTLTGGQVRALAVPRVGERVAKGQVLARLWTPEVRAAFEELLLARDLGEPWLGAARGRLRNAGVADAEIDAALTAGAVPETFSVRAPLAGVVTARPVTEGTWVGPGGTVAEIAPADALVVEVTVTGETPAPGTVLTLAGGGETWAATIVATLPVASAAGRQLRLTVDAAVPVGRPLVATWDEPAGDGVWVPRSALVDTGVRTAVFVSAGGAFTPREVTVGNRTADEVQITSGLAAGEEVVVHGTFLFDAETQMRSGGGHGGHGS
ncbi:MAG: efflux RND transporter periplasmic adaptor subunit [Myxococcota bacterium]